MYFFGVSKSDLGKILPIFFGILFIIFLMALVAILLVKRRDNNKELVIKRVRILEKPIHQGSIEWYVVECENGERIKLRSFKANDIIIAVGDVGLISYKGQTIESFQRQM